MPDHAADPVAALDAARQQRQAVAALLASFTAEGMADQEEAEELACLDELLAAEIDALETTLAMRDMLNTAHPSAFGHGTGSLVKRTTGPLSAHHAPPPPPGRPV